MPDPYGRLGRGYAAVRRPDPRIAGQIRSALGDARSVVNVGAGTGAYEPPDLDVLAVEPSATMRAQRPASAAPCIAASADALPLEDGARDAALAVLSMHHWPSPFAGLAEMSRVARLRVVLCTFDPELAGTHWLVSDYLPEIADLDRERFPPLEDVAAALGGTVRTEPVPIPHDCTDGFQGAYWRRPSAYLDPAVRAGISTLQLLPPAIVERGLRELAADLDSGDWKRRHGPLLSRDAVDIGYRLVIAEFA